MSKNRVALVSLITIGIVFLGIRAFSIAGYLKPIFQELLNMVYYKQHYTYDQKMLDLRGNEYRAIMTIRDSTPQNAVIYSDMLDFKILLAQALLYPRKVYSLEEKELQQLGEASYIYQNHELSKL